MLMWRNNYCGVTSFGRDKCSRHLIQCTFSIPFISWKPTVWPAIDCLQIMVCSGVFCGNYYSTYEQLQPFSCMKNGRSLTWDVRDWFKYENKLCDQVITFFNSTKLQNIMFCPCLVDWHHNILLNCINYCYCKLLTSFTCQWNVQSILFILEVLV